MSKVLVLGGYGNFGKRIARQLAGQGVSVIIAGRDKVKADALAQELGAEAASLDITQDFTARLRELKPSVVVNTIGPFQTSNYSVAERCIECGVHYIDLADGRDFVTGITELDAKAKQAGVVVISGASTVPALTSAVVEHFRPEFSAMEELTFGIAPGQKAERGLATTQAIMGYVGKKLKPCAGYPVRYGWQDTYLQRYPGIGRRFMSNCDVPDLDLLPPVYGLRKIRFSAGMENPFVHMGIWAMSWLVRAGLPIDLAAYAAPLLNASHWFDFIGSADGGMHVMLTGKDSAGRKLTKTWFIVALDGDGPFIPTIPAVVLARKLALGEPMKGALPCVGLVSLAEYVNELKAMNIKTYEFSGS